MSYFENLNCLFPRSRQHTSAGTYANPSLSLTSSTVSHDVNFDDQTNAAPDPSQLNRCEKTKNCCLEFFYRLSQVLVGCGIASCFIGGVGLPVGLGILLLGLLIFAVSTAAIANEMPPEERPAFVLFGVVGLLFGAAFLVTIHCLGLGLNVT